MAVNVKFTFNNETRRFGLARSAGYEELRAKVANILNLPAENLRLSYKDEDGDDVVIASDAEVTELISTNDSVAFNVKVLSAAATAGASNETPSSEPAETTTETSAASSETAQKLETTAPETSTQEHSEAKHEAKESQQVTQSANNLPVRSSQDVQNELSQTLQQLNERNQDLLTKLSELRQELRAKEQEEAESKFNAWLQQLHKPEPGFRSRTVHTNIVNGVKTTVIQEVDENGNETLTKITNDGSKTVTYNGKPKEATPTQPEKIEQAKPTQKPSPASNANKPAIQTTKPKSQPKQTETVYVPRHVSYHPPYWSTPIVYRPKRFHFEEDPFEDFVHPAFYRSNNLFDLWSF